MLIRLALAAAFALSVALAFPFRAGEVLFDLGSVAGWLVPVFFVGLIRDLPPGRAFRWATVAGREPVRFLPPSRSRRWCG